MAMFNNREIFFGVVGELDRGAAVDKLPSWFPEVDPIGDLKTQYGDDLSEYYADFVCKTTSVTNIYVYIRCYCNTADSLKIFSSNGSQIKLSYTVNGSKIAYRSVAYSSDGTSKSFDNSNWGDMDKLLSNNFDTSKLCIVNKGKLFTLSTYNLNFLVL